MLTVSQIRDELARMAKVKAACPMTTGMFMRIAAEAAEIAARTDPTMVGEADVTGRR